MADALTADDDVRRVAVQRVLASIREESRIAEPRHDDLPDPLVVRQITDALVGLVFPGYFSLRHGDSAGGGHDGDGKALAAAMTAALEQVGELLAEQIRRALTYRSRDGFLSATTQQPDVTETIGSPQQVVTELYSRLPQIRSMISLDVQAAFDGDPAATHVDEIILCYPGLRAVAVHRLAHQLYRMSVPLIPRMMAEFVHGETGIDIHPGAHVGRSFFIDHGTGVVIGETTVIGDHCKIYQGVTLGARSFPKDEHGRLRRGAKRHPTLEDHVTVYAGATILGGDTIVGAGSVVNGGVFLTGSVPPGHVVRGPKAEITLRSNPDMPPPMYAI